MTIEEVTVEMLLVKLYRILLLIIVLNFVW